MKKHGTKLTAVEPPIVSWTPASTGQITLPGLALNTRHLLREFMLSAGMEAFVREMEDDRTLLCGPKGEFQTDRRAYRHGHDVGTLVMGGRKVRLPKPRVRSVEGRELELPHWRLFSQEDPLDERVQEQMLVGISTRKYARSLEELPQGLRQTGIRRSSVSRRFVARTARIVEEFLGRSLAEIDLSVILLDGVHLGDHVLVVALGIDVTGKKHVLGVVEGTTESEEVGKSLLRGLIDRGLRVERARLFVIDGGKGLRKAIRSVFGEWALVQRCQVHKMRNVLEHLPERQRVWVRASLRRAWSAPTVGRARDLLRTLAGKLHGDHPGAANSIDEGLDETLTLIRLGLVGALHQSLRSTNPIENLQGSIRRVTRNVKRWKGGSMALRWTVSAVLEAEKSFRRVKGHRDMPQFVAALEAVLGGKAVDREAQIA
jgi:transposase-like protein